VLGANYTQTIGLSITGASVTLFARENTSSSGPFAYYPYTYGFRDMSLTNATVSGFDWSGVLAVSDGESVSFYLNQGGQVFSGASADFSNTLQFSFLNLPSDVTFTSDSGVFLTGGVPEPSIWAMMLTGFLGLGALAWRRGETVATA